MARELLVGRDPVTGAVQWAHSSLPGSTGIDALWPTLRPHAAADVLFESVCAPGARTSLVRGTPGRSAASTSGDVRATKGWPNDSVSRTAKQSRRVTSRERTD